MLTYSKSKWIETQLTTKIPNFQKLGTIEEHLSPKSPMKFNILTLLKIARVIRGMKMIQFQTDRSIWNKFSLMKRLKQGQNGDKFYWLAFQRHF